MQVAYDALETVTICLRKINERDDYGVPFSEQPYTHGSLCLNPNRLLSLIPPNGLKF